VVVGHVQEAAVSVPGLEPFEGPQVLLGSDGAGDGVPGGLGEGTSKACADAGDAARAEDGGLKA
jgi:hypothetical protein